MAFDSENSSNFNEYNNNSVMIFFKESEFKMGGERVFDKMDKDFLVKLDELRGYVGQPLIITSSYRSLEYNKAIGGAKRSMHMKGKAVDVVCLEGKFRRDIVHNALKLGLTCGIASNFIHLDDRYNQIIFTY